MWTIVPHPRRAGQFYICRPNGDPAAAATDYATAAAWLSQRNLTVIQIPLFV